jgi:hypothetical protein
MARARYLLAGALGAVVVSLLLVPVSFAHGWTLAEQHERGLRFVPASAVLRVECSATTRAVGWPAK